MENKQQKESNFNLKVMRWINIIAITMFVLGILYKIFF
ncbi:MULTISPECIES: DUF6728 family protein [Pedobacter]|nr:DUF6728 family protein [Pedobacter montanisoli]